MTMTTLQWVSTEQLLERLCLSRSYLFKLKADRTLKPGVHYRQNGTGSRPLAWDLAAVDQLLRQQAADD